jgi:D-beta-D-heptose 7-phosphate kinase/D-beta-D-heptose 1-phosphate adenosyltransferase
MRKICTIPQLQSILANIRGLLDIVTTNGCFDIIHVGHIRFLQEASKLGDFLVVGINSDESVRQNKGPTRPLIPQNERAEIIAALDCVDYVCIFEDKDVIPFLKEIRPDIHCKGGDYGTDPKKLIETEVVESLGGTVQIIPLELTQSHGMSTTRLIEKIEGS